MLPAEYQTMHFVELKHWWFRARRRLLLELLAGLKRDRADPFHILDFGCGTGGNTTTYGRFGTTVGIEPDSNAVRLAQARGGASYCCGNGVQLPFRAAAFDVIIASDVLEHIEADSAAVEEMVRVLRPGGSLIITVPAHQWLFSEHDTALHHFRRYSKASLRALLVRHRLRIRRLSYWNTTLFPIICLYRLLQQRRRPVLPHSDTSLPPALINEALAVLLAGEVAVLRYARLPWGLSLVVVAEPWGERFTASI